MKTQRKTDLLNRRQFIGFASSNGGATAIEYGMIAGVVGLTLAALMPSLRDRFTGARQRIDRSFALPADGCTADIPERDCETSQSGASTGQ